MHFCCCDQSLRHSQSNTFSGQYHPCQQNTASITEMDHQALHQWFQVNWQKQGLYHLSKPFSVQLDPKSTCINYEQAYITAAKM